MYQTGAVAAHPLFTAVYGLNLNADNKQEQKRESVSRLRAETTDINDMQRYMDAYRKTTTLSDEQVALFECARLTLIATPNGNAPSFAVEHGCQSVLAESKPSYQELDDFIRNLRREPEPTAENIEARLEKFYASLETEK